MISKSAQGLVLSSRDYRDKDRWVSILTPDHGRVDVLAKSVRTLNSKRRSSLISGNIIRFSWVGKGETKVLTEVVLARSLQMSDTTLERLRDLQGVMEIVYHLSLEEAEQELFYQQAVQLVQYVGEAPQYSRGVIRAQLKQLTQDQGFEAEHDSAQLPVTQLVESILGRKLRAFAFLRT